MASSQRLQGRIALITGASRGIGAAVAKRFAAEGARLVLVARTVGGLEETDDAVRSAGGGPATLVPMDLRDGAAVDRLGGALHQKFGRLDILVGNAAVLGELSPVGHIEPKTWDETVAVNLTANYRLIRSLDPLLRLSEAGRALFVSSGAAGGAAFWGAYAATKAGMETLVRCYAAEMRNTTVRVNIVDPGVQRTRMRAQAFPGEDPMTLPAPDEMTGVFVDLTETACRRTGEVVRAYRTPHPDPPPQGGREKAT
jgi:NAD(P)-dependent dehydrogenase (short-subunit alcohol dehydrogenase family)